MQALKGAQTTLQALAESGLTALRAQQLETRRLEQHLRDLLFLQDAAAAKKQAAEQKQPTYCAVCADSTDKDCA